MTALPIPIEITLGVTVVAAAASDLWRREIPNWLTLGAIGAGLALHPVFNGWVGLKFSLYGLGLAALIFLPLFMLRWLGGGDVKLMGAVGALGGWENLIAIFILDALLAGAVALVLVIVRGRLLRTLKNMLRMGARERAPELEAGNEKSLGLPRAVTIAIATLVVFWVTQGHSR
jgi:prepilin peptidase CpaA